MLARHVKLVLTAALLVPLMLVGCSNSANTGKGGDFENIDWKLTNYLAAGDSLESVPSSFIISAKFQDGRLSGRALNSYSGSYEAKGDGALTIGQVNSTLMAGPQDQMDAEKFYFDALQKTASYTSDGSTLKLFDADGNELLIYAKNDVTLTGAWTVTNYNNGQQAVVGLVADTEITMEFTEDGKVSGKAVNTFNGDFTTSGTDGIDFGPFATTKMMGPEDQMKQEQQFLAALQAAQTYSIQGNTLEFRQGETLQVIAQRAK